jgi:hypothetical protein
MVINHLFDQLARLALQCLRIPFRTAEDRNFLQEAQVFSTVCRLMEASGRPESPGAGTSGASDGVVLCAPVDVTRDGRASAGANGGMLGSLTDGDTQSFWESDKGTSSPPYGCLLC